jgi:hypothetical protein
MYRLYRRLLEVYDPNRLANLRREFNSIEKFADINTKAKLEACIEFFGHNSFFEEEEAYTYLKERVEMFNNLPNLITLYRVVLLNRLSELRRDNLGSSFVLDRNKINDEFLNLIVENRIKGKKAFIIEVLVHKSEIDVKTTLLQNLNFLAEEEITLKNDGRNIKIVNITEM